MLACGVPLHFSAGELVGIAFPDFTLSVLPLGLTLLMALMAIRIGYRLSAASSLWPAWLGWRGRLWRHLLWLSLVIQTEAVVMGEWGPLFIPAAFFGGLLLSRPSREGVSSSLRGQWSRGERAGVSQGLASSAFEKLHWSIKTVLLQPRESVSR